MKAIKVLLTTILLAATAVTVSSCGDDEPSPAKNNKWTLKKNGTTYTHNVVAAGIFYSEEEGYNLLLADEDISIHSEMDNPDPECHWLRLVLPFEIIGEKITSPDDLDGIYWYFGIQSDDDNPVEGYYSKDITKVSLNARFIGTKLSIDMNLTISNGSEYTLSYSGVPKELNNDIGPYFPDVSAVSTWRHITSSSDKTYFIAAAGVGIVNGNYNFVFTDKEQTLKANMKSLEGNWIYIDVPKEMTQDFIYHPENIVNGQWYFRVKESGSPEIQKANIKDIYFEAYKEDYSWGVMLFLQTTYDDKYCLYIDYPLTEIYGNKIIYNL